MRPRDDSRIAAGRPTVGEVADAGEVSRRTAYRYCPTQSKLLIEAALEGLRPTMDAAIAAGPADPEASLEGRVDRLVSALSVCTGIEAFLVLRDIRGLTTAQAIDLSRWIARAILHQALADARTAHRTR